MKEVCLCVFVINTIVTYENIPSPPPPKIIIIQRFRRYITSTQDREELLLATVDSLCREQRRLFQLRRQALPSEITLDVEDLESRVS